MKLTYIAALTLGSALMAIAPAASAGCGDSRTCSSGWTFASGHYSGSGSGYGYMSGSSHSYGGVAPCPAGTRPSSDGTCLVTGSGYGYGGSSYSGSSSYSSSSSYSYSSAPLGSYRGHTGYTSSGIVATMSDAEADRKYGSGSISGTYTDGSNTIIPFTTTTENLTNYRVPGMGANEFLTPTKCPVSVYNPGGGKVLGCYNVSKPAPVRPVYPVYPTVHTVRVVRPVIYVHYPVGVPACNVYKWYSRYGEQWPRGGCGW